MGEFIMAKKKYKKASERESIVQDLSYIQVEGWMVNQLNLKGNTLMVYAIIHGFTNSENTSIDKFKGSLRYLADWTNSSKQGVLNALDNLMESDYIEKNPIEVNGVNYVEYRSRMLYDKVKEVAYRSQKTWIENVNYVDRDIKQSGHNTIDNTPEVTKGVNQEGTKVPEDVSPKTEDTPSPSEIEDMKKQMAEIQKMLQAQIEQNKREKEEERKRIDKEVQDRFEEAKKKAEGQEQGQNLVEKTDKTKPSLKEGKDDKVKGEQTAEEAQNAFFDELGFDYVIPTSREEEKSATDEIREEADEWFLN
jgi:hypothetical protein